MMIGPDHATAGKVVATISDDNVAGLAWASEDAMSMSGFNCRRDSSLGSLPGLSIFQRSTNQSVEFADTLTDAVRHARLGPDSGRV